MGFAIGVVALVFLSAFMVLLIGSYNSVQARRAKHLEKLVKEIDSAAETEYIVADSPFAAHIRALISKEI